MYALFANTRLTAKNIDTGRIWFFITDLSTFLAFTPGNISVNFDISCVRMVARNICHVVRNIGNGKSNCGNY